MSVGRARDVPSTSPDFVFLGGRTEDFGTTLLLASVKARGRAEGNRQGRADGILPQASKQRRDRPGMVFLEVFRELANRLRSGRGKIHLPAEAILQGRKTARIEVDLQLVPIPCDHRPIVGRDQQLLHVVLPPRPLWDR